MFVETSYVSITYSIRSLEHKSHFTLLESRMVIMGYVNYCPVPNGLFSCVASVCTSLYPSQVCTEFRVPYTALILFMCCDIFSNVMEAGRLCCVYG